MSRGYNALGDVIKKTVDGRDLNSIWEEFAQTITARNQHRQAIASLFSYPTTLAADEVVQPQSFDDFEAASEFGEPKSIRAGANTIKTGFGFQFYDLATRFTWRFLAEASAAQIESAHQAALDADNRLVWKTIMGGLLTKTTIATRPVNEDGVAIVPLWDGETDALPPEHAGQTFVAGHQHYLTSGGATFDGTDLKDIIRHVTHHGYGVGDGTRLLVLMHPDQGEVARGFRVAGSQPQPFDFIASSEAPAYLTNLNVVGQTPPNEFNGLKVIGSYGNAWIVEDWMVPTGYLVCVATSGADAAGNPLAFREHKRQELQGLRHIAGNSKDYPLTESFYSRGFGVGIRHRGAAAVMQVTAGAYTAPVL